MPSMQLNNNEAIKFGWEKMKSYFWLFFQIQLITLILNLISEKIDKQQQVDFNFPLAIVWLGLMLLSIFLGMNTYKIALKLYNNQPTTLNDLFTNGEKFLSYIWVTILYSLIVIAGFILLIIPGVIWAIKYQFAFFFVLDKGLKGGEALKASAAITNGYKWQLFGFMFLTLLLNIAGMLALLVGLFFTIPTTIMAYTYIYKKLQGAVDQATTPTPEAMTSTPPTAAM